jgi:uncharacterized phage-associated protein
LTWSAPHEILSGDPYVILTFMIRFQFNLNKAVGAMVYLVDRVGPMDKIKLIKLLYLVDRESFLTRERPLTGDRQVAMPHGPVPSRCLDAIDGNLRSDLAFRFLHVDDARIERRNCGTSPIQLAPDEIEILDRIIERHGDTPPWELAEWTEKLPEYKEAYVDGSSATIPYEALLKHYGSRQQYEMDRPVVSRGMASHMVSPFPRSEPDL